MAIATRNGAYIGGQWIEGDGERIEVTSPGSGETVGAVTASSEAQVDAQRGDRPDDHARDG